LPRRVGVGPALAALLDGETFSAARALELGMVSRVVDDEALEEVADATVDRLASGATVAASFATRLVRRGLECSLDESLEAEAEAMAHCSTTADFAEGLAAFRTRRAPIFRGS